jgi:D-serine deaminase-like pyridoxal phosphate-dependent protein
MPELILDKEKCLRNMEKMVLKARNKGLDFRPHCKTHQSAEIGNWFREFGITKITVSSFRMAAYFAKAGFKDILVAFPFDPNQLKLLNSLSEKANLSILLDNPDLLPYLHRIENRVPFFIDIDTGYGRTGIPTEDTQVQEELIQQSSLNPKLLFSGFYCHAGHSYKTPDPEEKKAIHTKAIGDLALLKEQFHTHNPIALYGDTPNCSIQEDFTGIDVLTPGNFVFYDLIQAYQGACEPEDIAVAMRCPVVSKYPKQDRLLIHGGAVHFSKESLEVKGSPVFGQLLTHTEGAWSASPHTQFIHSISQEHGLLEKCGSWMDEVNPGDSLYFLPVHSCLTANLMREYLSTDGQLIKTLNSSF